MKIIISKSVKISAVASSCLFIFPISASADIITPETKRVVCSGHTFLLTHSKSGKMNLVEAGKRTLNFSGMKIHTNNLKKVMNADASFNKSSLKCENGAVKIDFLGKTSTKNQSLLITQSGRIMDVTPVSSPPPPPPSIPWWQNWRNWSWR